MKSSMVGSLLVLMVGPLAAVEPSVPPPVEPAPTRWAKPLAGGSIRALVIGPKYGQREVIELAARMDLQADWAPAPLNRNEAGAAEMLDQLAGKLGENFQIMILGGVGWSVFSEDIQGRILAKVREGTPLLCVDPQGMKKNLYQAFESGKVAAPATPAIAGIPFDRLPGLVKFPKPEDFSAKGLGESRSEKGKIVFLRYPSGRGEILFLTPAGKSSLVEYEYYLSLLAKTILRAVDRPPADGIAAVVLEGGKTNVRLKKAAKGRTVTVRVRDADARNEGETKAPADGEAVSTPLPELFAGTHFVDVFLNAGDPVVDWYSCALEVASETKVEIALDQEFFQPGEKIQGKVRVAPATTGSLRISLEDCLGRVIAVSETPAQAETPFVLSPLPPLAVLHQVRAELRGDQKAPVRANVWFPVKQRWNPKDFYFILWADNDFSWLYRTTLRLARANGVDSILAGGFGQKEELEKTGQSDLRPYPYIFTLKACSATKEMARQPCFSSPAFRERMKEDLLAKTKLLSPYSPLGYTLGDENELSHESSSLDFCFSPDCLKDLQEYLKKEYGSIEAVNREWGTSFPDWSVVRPFRLAELLEKKEDQNFSSWIDHRLHMESVFAGINRLGVEAIRSVDREAWAGAEGIWGEGNSFVGKDAAKLGQALYAAGGYGDTTLWAAFLPNPSLLWDWGLYEKNVVKGRRFPWRLLLSGGNGVGFFSGISPGEGGLYSAFDPDFSLEPSFAAFAEETRRIKEGIGRLLLSCEAEYSPIAVLHSPPNLHLSTALRSVRQFNHVGNRNGMEDFLKALWYYPNFISYRQVREGALKGGKVHCLVLGGCLAISEAERKELKEFVRNGGLLIADFLPGPFDGHGKMVAANDLEELFGCKHKRWPSPPDMGVLLGNTELRIAAAEDLALTTGQASAKSKKDYPVLVVNAYGKGKAICLNVEASNLKSMKADAALPLYPLIAAQLAAHGLGAPLTAARAKGDGEGPAFGGIARFFSSGKNRHLLILPEINQDLQLGLASDANVYDVLAGKGLGRLKEVPLSLKTDQPVLLSLLGYQVKDLDFKFPESVAAGTSPDGEIRVVTDGAPCELHGVRLVVRNPSGAVVPYLTRNVVCEKGPGKFTLPVALNEPPGKWTLEAKDISTGVVKKVTFEVRKGP